MSTSTQLQTLSKDELIEKVLELEAVLNEFQDSSKELERALEDELLELENTKSQLSEQLDLKKQELAQANTKVINLTSELNNLHESTNTKLYEKDEIIHNLTSQLVKTEIMNDSMENEDRIKTNKYEDQQKFNNHLLEKLALLESDYERERKLNIEKQLYITNYQNQIKDLNRKIETLESQKIENDIQQQQQQQQQADVLMISFKEMLKSTPPPNKIRDAENQKQSNIKKSDSLRKLKNLTMDIEAFLGNFSLSSSSNKSPPSPKPSSKILKSPSTTQLDTSITTDRSHNNNNDGTITKDKRLSYSKRFVDLPSIRGSPTPSKRSNIEKSKSMKHLRM